MANLTLLHDHLVTSPYKLHPYPSKQSDNEKDMEAMLNQNQFSKPVRKLWGHC